MSDEKATVAPDDSMQLKPIPDGFKVDVDHWKMDKHFQWDDNITQTDKPESRAIIVTLLASAIVEWPYPYEPRNPDTYIKELDPKEYLTACRAVSVACYNAFLV